ncbi:MAG: hypothetical protein ACJA01_004163 [Saprospiraceae bacterium]|jgi:uncharacterized protein (DUF1330 family)
MNLTNQITPKKEEFIDFIKNYPSGTSITMVNILKFKEKSGNGDETGKEAYLRYSKNMVPFIEKAEGKVIWMGNIERTIIGDYDAQPDMVLIVSYPSKEAFIDMSTSPAYVEVSKDRKIALEYGALLSSTTVG